MHSFQPSALIRTSLTVLLTSVLLAGAACAQGTSDGSVDSMWLQEPEGGSAGASSSTAAPAQSSPSPGASSVTTSPEAAPVEHPSVAPYWPSSSPASPSSSSGSSSTYGLSPSTLPAGTASASSYGSAAATETAMVGTGLTDGAASVVVGTAPMCTVTALKASTMVAAGGWPGVGPFRNNTDNLYLDKAGNTLKLETTGDRVTQAQLTLVNRRPSARNARDIMDMQMSIDFLLEAVGIKPKKILEFNDKMSASRQDLFNSGGTLTLSAGRMQLQIAKQPSAAAGATDFIISVNSLDASRNAIAEHAKGSDSDRDKSDSGSKKGTTTPYTPPVVRSSTGVTPAPASSQDLKAQFTQLLDNWQRVKRGALRNRQADQLGTILGGRALTRQTDAIKWLLEHHKYYDMVPKGVFVDRFTEILSQHKYMVLAQVREASKYKDDSNGDTVIKETDDTYKVNYTVEKIGGHWLITDSALLNKSQVAPAKVSTGKQAH